MKANLYEYDNANEAIEDAKSAANDIREFCYALEACVNEMNAEFETVTEENALLEKQVDELQAKNEELEHLYEQEKEKNEQLEKAVAAMPNELPQRLRKLAAVLIAVAESVEISAEKKEEENSV
jgi:predicted  nucleic acid-binding Zn-ribbon protein